MNRQERKSRNTEVIRTQILTSVRKDNNVLQEIIQRMKLRMELPVVERQYAKHLLKHEHSVRMKEAYIPVRPFIWLDYMLTRKRLLNKLMAQIQGDTKKGLEATEEDKATN